MVQCQQQWFREGTPASSEARSVTWLEGIHRMSSPMLLFQRWLSFVGGSPHTDLATASPTPWGRAGPQPGSLSLQICRCSRSALRRLGAVTGDCSSLGWEVQVSRPSQFPTPNPACCSLTEHSRRTNAGARQSLIRADFTSSFILNFILL